MPPTFHERAQAPTERTVATRRDGTSRSCGHDGRLGAPPWAEAPIAEPLRGSAARCGAPT